MVVVAVNVVRALYGSTRQQSEASPLVIFLLFAALMAYLVLSTSRTGVKLVISLILLLQLFDIVQILLRLEYLNMALELFFIGFAVYLTRALPR